MLRKEAEIYIKAQVERAVYQKDIARELGVHPKTISRALKHGGPPSGRRPSIISRAFIDSGSTTGMLLAICVWERCSPNLLH